MNNKDHKDMTGYILAGGKSKRMGIDKRWIKIGQYSLIERTYHLLTNTLSHPPIIVCNDTETVFPSTWEVIHDKVLGKGPLGGLVALLEHCRSDWALVLPVDLPHLTSEVINLLLASPRNGYEVITLSESGDPEPMIALYSKSTLNFWTQRLNDGNLSLYKGIRKLKWKPVLIPIGSQALTNLNTPKDLTKLI
ncbi:molybdenum cofactor guanylyltransferase [bacterium]|nr:molybdenum cofactor guanylyltransferase [bacterium]